MEYDDTALQYAKDLVAVNVRVAESIITEAVGSYDTKDFSIVERFDGTLVGNPKVEVWTMRAFDAHEIFFVPDTHAVLDRMYTQGRSSLIRGGERLHPQKKQLVLDGKLRSRPGLESRPFAMFFIVDRTEDPKLANLDMGVASPSIEFKMSLPGHANLRRLLTSGSAAASGSGDANKGVPYMFNPKKIEKHTRLVALHEVELSKIASKEAEEKKAQAKKAAKELEAANKKKAEEKAAAKAGGK
jgi:hypothetical protein